MIGRNDVEIFSKIKSRPFPKPKTGKIAIKVINHYGDEVLKVSRSENRRRRLDDLFQSLLHRAFQGEL